MSLEDFRQYCEKNQNFPQSYSDYEPHKRFLHRIISNPREFIKDIKPTYKYCEVRLFDGQTDGGCIDATFFTDIEDVYIVEAKVVNRDRGVINYQLYKQYKFIKENFEILPIRIGMLMIGRRVTKKIIYPEIDDILKLQVVKR